MDAALGKFLEAHGAGPESFRNAQATADPTTGTTKPVRDPLVSGPLAPADNEEMKQARAWADKTLASDIVAGYRELEKVLKQIDPIGASPFTEKQQNMVSYLMKRIRHAARIDSDRTLNAQTDPYSGKLADKPIFDNLAAGKPEDQALVEKLDVRVGRADEGRRTAVVPERGNAETDRAERVAGAIGKKVVWVRNLGTDGVSDPTIPGVIFLDPGSKRSLQVLAAHELAHSLERDNPIEFNKLAACRTQDFKISTLGYA